MLVLFPSLFHSYTASTIGRPWKIAPVKILYTWRERLSGLTTAQIRLLLFLLVTCKQPVTHKFILYPLLSAPHFNNNNSYYYCYYYYCYYYYYCHLIILMFSSIFCRNFVLTFTYRVTIKDKITSQCCYSCLQNENPVFLQARGGRQGNVKRSTVWHR